MPTTTRYTHLFFRLSFGVHLVLGSLIAAGVICLLALAEVLGLL
jgi:hypothetical protein